MLLIGSHVSFDKNSQLVKSVKEAISYNANTFMFYTGAPQNTLRCDINDGLTLDALNLIKTSDIDYSKVVVHAPYIINLANKTDMSKYEFSINFLRNELERVEQLGCKYLVLHPGSHVGQGIEEGIKNIAFALNEVLRNNKSVTILLESMAGKGSEVGTTIDELKKIIDLVDNKDMIGICLDTCHLNDSGYNLKEFDKILDEIDEKIGIDKIKCIHINDSKNEKGAHKDRHENIGLGTIGFDTLISIIYNKRLENVPKILESPYVDKIYAPYKQEIEMIRKKEFNNNLIEDIKNSN